MPKNSDFDYMMSDSQYMQIDDKLYCLIEEHFKIELATAYDEGVYHSFRNDVIQLFGEVFGEDIYKESN